MQDREWSSYRPDATAPAAWDVLPEPGAAARDGASIARRAAALVLVVLGLLTWVLATVVAAHTPRSYSTHRSPPAFVTVTEGRQYELGTSGGPAHTPGVALGVAPSCTIADDAGSVTHLSVTAETDDKAVHQIGSFVAPLSGRVHVACSQAGAVYVDDPDGAVDLAGVLRILAVVLLAVGVPLTLSVLAAGVSGGRTRT